MSYNKHIYTTLLSPHTTLSPAQTNRNKWKKKSESWELEELFCCFIILKFYNILLNR